MSKWDNWDVYEELPARIRAIQVTDSNIDKIKAVLEDLRGEYHFKSWNGNVLLIQKKSMDMFSVRAGDYIRIVGKKLEKMHKEDFENRYEKAIKKSEIIKMIK